LRVPVSLPDLGAADEPIRISCWLVDLGEPVDEGDRLLEVLIQGVTFDVPAPATGVLTRIEKSLDARVHTGEALGWIETREDEP
jgi:pyruvate/2-oxoglutarate dehydrogenase complex dihydrolipoamide acyltransferase (E2) component